MHPLAKILSFSKIFPKFDFSYLKLKLEGLKRAPRLSFVLPIRSDFGYLHILPSLNAPYSFDLNLKLELCFLYILHEHLGGG